MATAKQPVQKFQIRDWIILALGIVIIASNWMWYQQLQGQRITNESGVKFDIMLQAQVNKLKACVDESTRPCDISPQ